MLYSVGDAAGELGGGAVEFVGAVAEAVFLEFDQAAAEGVGFEDIDAGFEEGGVDAFDDGRVDKGRGSRCSPLCRRSPRR